MPEFRIEVDGKEYIHQTGYNKAFDRIFQKMGWEHRPVLHKRPGLTGVF
ncbi:MAG: hypothetical protein JW885_01820 [Deltaproteobacteria bacterium]|nr:hypothetical protein [Candidatus Zymogenaceae bacterium]